MEVSMFRFIHPGRALAALVFALCANLAFAQAQPAAKDFEPHVGQAGKDVVWVPTSQALVDKMLDMAKATPADYVIDLGSGDGRTVITAAKRGIRALGIEYNPEMVELSKRNAAKEGVAERATFMKADLFETDLSQATVITMFLLPDINVRLRPKILDLRPGTRIVSNSFTMGEWEADQTVGASDTEGCMTYCTAYLWIVPAKVEGTWHAPQGEFALKQLFQKFTGTLKSGGSTTVLANGRLRGDQISFTASGAQYSGRVRGDTIEGTVKSAAGTSPWRATRAR
jgi:SAM-dependent methyltransferase